MRMRTRRWQWLATALTLFTLTVQAARQPEYYVRWNGLTSEQLLQMGRQFEQHGQADSAFSCFAIVGNRYDNHLGREDKMRCIEALSSMFNFYFTRYFDYGKAYECIYRADAIQQDLGVRLPRLALSFGNIYSTIDDQWHDPQLAQKAIGYYRECFWASLSTGDTVTLHKAFSNLNLSCYGIHQMDSVRREAEAYEQISSADPLFGYYADEHRGLLALERGDGAAALTHFDRQQAVGADIEALTRSNTNVYMNRYAAYMMMGDTAQAFVQLQQLERLTTDSHVLDALMDTYRLRSEYHGLRGEQLPMLQYRNRYLEFRDSLISYHQMASIEETQFLGQLKEADAKLTDMNRRRQLAHLGMLAALALVAVIAVFSVLLYRRYRQLQQKNQVLFDKQQEALAPRQERKYKDSTLSDDDKTDIISRIRSTLQDCDEIFSPDFTIQRLAELVGVKSRQVSQVVGEKTDGNFNVLINEFRIKEACRRINDAEHYANYTLEAISHEVGFKSRSSFNASFRRFTGLTPSEYLKISQRSHTAPS